MAWDDCFTCSDYDRYIGYSDTSEPEPPDDWYPEPPCERNLWLERLWNIVKRGWVTLR